MPNDEDPRRWQRGRGAGGGSHAQRHARAPGARGPDRGRRAVHSTSEGSGTAGFGASLAGGDARACGPAHDHTLRQTRPWVRFSHPCRTRARHVAVRRADERAGRALMRRRWASTHLPPRGGGVGARRLRRRRCRLCAPLCSLQRVRRRAHRGANGLRRRGHNARRRALLRAARLHPAAGGGATRADHTPTQAEAQRCACGANNLAWAALSAPCVCPSSPPDVPDQKLAFAVDAPGLARGRTAEGPRAALRLALGAERRPTAYLGEVRSVLYGGAYERNGEFGGF